MFAVHTPSIAANATAPNDEPDALTSDLTRASTRSITLPAGWSLVSLPLVAVNTQAAAVFGDLPAPLNVYDHAAGRTLGPDEPAFRNVVPGRAFWLLLEQPTALSVIGAALAPDIPQRLSIEPGWNAVATPWLTPVEWSDARVSVVSGGETLPLSEAVTRGWLSASLFQYDSAGDSYREFAANAEPPAELHTWQGSLLNASVAGELVFSPPPADDAPPVVSIAAPAEAEGVSAPVPVVGSVSDPNLSEWRLELAQAGSPDFRTLDSGVTEIDNASLGTLDPTLLLNGQYEVRLSARDSQGHSSSTSVTVVVKDDLKLGHFRLAFADLELPLGGLPIEVVRTYDSRDKSRGDFGVGWRLELSDVRVQENGVPGRTWKGVRTGGLVPTYCLQPARPKRVTLTLPDARVLEFEPYAIPECQEALPPQHVSLGYRPLPGTHATLEALDVDTVTTFGTWPTSPGSAALTLIDIGTLEPFDPQRYLVTLPDGGVTLTIDQLAGLQQVTDEDGNALSIGPAGILHTSGRAVAFNRDALGRITRITDPLGNALAYTYDASGDLVSFQDRAENETTFEYAGEHFLVAIHDPLGRVPLRSEYDDDGRLVRHTDAAGHSVSFGHDVFGRQQVVTDRLGRATLLTYDLRGNVVQELNPAGETVTRTFDERDNRLSETDGLGHTTAWTYDADDNVTSVRDPLDHVTSYTYNASNQVLTTTDPRGLITTYRYDTRNHLTSITDAAGNETRMAHNELGHLLWRRDPLGHTTTFSHNPYGEEVAVVDPAGHETTRVFDAGGRTLSETRTRMVGGSPQASVTNWAYDPQGRVTQLERPGGGRSVVTFDPEGRELSLTDALERVSTFEYDDLGRPTRTNHPDGTYEERTYDSEGQVSSERDRAGRVTSYEYDDAGRVTRTLWPDGSQTSAEYDLAGRLVAQRDEQGNQTRYEYDAAGRRIRTVDALGNVVLEAYDTAGNRVSLRDAKGQTTSFVYDALDRVVEVRGPDGSTRATAYDAAGRVVSETDELGRITRLAYDERGFLTAVTDVADETTRYSYDELGQRISQTDANGHTTRFEYDAGRRLTRRVLPTGASETFTYDDAGNRTSRTDFAGHITSFSYDSDDRLVQRSYPDGSQVRFTYAPTGERLSAADARGTTSYAYDLRGRVTAVTYPDGRALGYAYNAAGRRSSLAATLGGLTYTTSYSHDGAGRLTSVGDPVGRTYTLERDPNGNLTRGTWPNALVTSLSYDSRDRLTRLLTSAPSGILRDDRLSLAADGRRDRINEITAARDYAYDAGRRLLSEAVSGAGSYSKAFSFDAVGNRTQQATTGTGEPGTPTAAGNQSYAYDDRDRLLVQGGQGLSYDANGNLVARAGEASYTWDFDDRLVRVQRADGTRVEHAYDADGLRVRTVVTPPGAAPQATDFLVDPAGGLSHVVAESAGGALRALYVRADDLLLAVLRPDGAGAWTSRFYHADALGSVRALTDESGQVTDTYEYTAFGETIEHAGSDPQPYGFAGEAYEPLAGLYYNRARWFEPRSGRFLSLDPWLGDPRQPDTLHRYVYAAGDPVNRTDPTGLMTLTETGVASKIASILRRIGSSRPIRFLTRGLRNKTKDMFFGIYATRFRMGPMTVRHAYIYAEQRGTAAGLKYDIGARRFRGLRSIFVAGQLWIHPVMRAEVKNPHKFAAHNLAQFGLWNLVVTRMASEPPESEIEVPITYSVLGPFLGQSCWSWTAKAAWWAFVLQILPIG